MRKDSTTPERRERVGTLRLDFDSTNSHAPSILTS
jgi:hypothetical protein